MTRTIIIVSAVITLFGSAAALDLGVSGFYSPGMAFGPAAEVNEVKPLGLSGDFNLRLNRNLALSLGGGYAVYKYRDAPHVVPAIAGYTLFDEIPIATINVGVDYGFPIAYFKPFVNAGAVAALELALYPEKTDIDIAPGVYVGGGVRYFFMESLGLEVGPRYTLLFDNPIIARFSLNTEPEYAEAHSQLFNLRVGLSYLF